MIVVLPDCRGPNIAISLSGRSCSRPTKVVTSDRLKFSIPWNLLLGKVTQFRDQYIVGCGEIASRHKKRISTACVSPYVGKQADDLPRCIASDLTKLKMYTPLSRLTQEIHICRSVRTVSDVLRAIDALCDRRDCIFDAQATVANVL